MIKKLGIKRAFLLLVLSLVLGALFMQSEFLLKPKVLQSQAQLASIQDEVSRLQSEVDKMTTNFALFEKQKVVYDTLLNIGFFNTQDRSAARERLNTMQRLSKIISARYEIKSAKVVLDEVNPSLKTDPNAVTTVAVEGGQSEDGGEKVNTYVVLESPVTITLSALDDLDIYRFIYYLNYGFPGHISIESLVITRTGDVTPAALKNISNKNPKELLSAQMNLVWRTYTRKESLGTKDIAPSSEAPAGAVR